MQSTDRALLTEFALTAEAVLELCEQSIRCDDRREAVRLRRTALAQLSVCRVIQASVRAKLALEGAAAAGSSSPAGAAPVNVLEAS